MIDTKGSPRVRFDVRDDVVADYAESYQNKVKMPEIVVFEVEPKRYLLADGWHRLHAMKAQEPDKKRLWAVDVRKGTFDDCLKFALQANVTHGLRRTNADKHAGAVAAIKAFASLSDTQIAVIAAVGNSLVGQVRKELAGAGEVPLMESRKGVDGKTYRSTNRKPDGKKTLKNASKSEEVPSAPAVPDISSAIHPSKDSGEELDETGYVIPEAIKEIWHRRSEVAEIMEQISRIKCSLDRAFKAGDPLYHEVSNSIIADLKMVREGVSYALPYAVCPICNGKHSVKCTLCRGRGMVSEVRYQTVSESIRKIREKVCKK